MVVKRTTAAEDRQEKRAEDIEGLFGIAQYGLLMTGNFADSGAISKHGSSISSEIAKLAARDTRIAKVVDKAGLIGPYSALLTATIPFVVQILVNHNVIPVEQVVLLKNTGVVPPAVLEADMKREIAKITAQAIQDQQRAEEELRDILQDQQRAEEELRVLQESIDRMEAGKVDA